MTDKERLEEIKNSHLRGIHSLFGTPWVSIPKENFDWLIEQAERVQELEKMLHFCEMTKLSMDSVEKYTEQLKEENKRYRVALEFYADKRNFKVDAFSYNPELLDSGEVARKALEGEE